MYFKIGTHPNPVLIPMVLHYLQIHLIFTYSLSDFKFFLLFYHFIHIESIKSLRIVPGMIQYRFFSISLYRICTSHILFVSYYIVRLLSSIKKYTKSWLVNRKEEEGVNY